MMTVDVIIPTYRPDKKFEYLIERLQKQEYPDPQDHDFEYGYGHGTT